MKQSSIIHKHISQSKKTLKQSNITVVIKTIEYLHTSEFIIYSVNTLKYSLFVLFKIYLYLNKQN